jgi:HdeA/HdeB family
MRNDWIRGPVTVGLVLGSLALAGPAHAQDRSKQVDKITCEEFLGLNPDDQQRIAYWVDGYAEAKNETAIGTVALDKFGQPIGALVEGCQATPKETLWQKLKKHL